MMMRILTLVALVAALVAAPALAYAAADDIGVVNMSKVLGKYNKVKSVNNQLAKAKEERQSRLDSKQSGLKDIKDKLDKDFKSLSDDEKRKRGKQLEQGLEDLQEYHDKLMGELRELQADKFKDLEEDIVAAVKRVAKAKNLSMVVERGVVFTGGVDITDAVIADLNGGSAGDAKPTKKKDGK